MLKLQFPAYLYEFNYLKAQKVFRENCSIENIFAQAKICTVRAKTLLLYLKQKKFVNFVRNTKFRK